MTRCSSDHAFRLSSLGSLFSVVAILLLIGCRPSATEKPGQTEYRVKDISFEGVEVLDEDEIIDALATQVDRYNPFQAKKYLNTYSMASDIDRIEVFYRHNGFFDAQVVDQDVEYKEKREVAKVTYTISEGEPTVVISTIFVMLDENGTAVRLRSTETGGRGLREINAEELTKNLETAEQQRYSRDSMLLDADEMRRRLQENSYAKARVDARAFVDRENREATVVFVVDQGPACVFGNIYVDGNEKIPDEEIVESLEIKPNEQMRYKHSLISEAQRKLYDWNTFTQVLVQTSVSRQRAREDDDGIDIQDTEEDDGYGSLTPSMARALQQVDAELSLRFVYIDRAYAGPDGTGYLQAALGGFNPGAVSVEDTSVDVYIEVSEKADSNYRFALGQQIDSGRWETFLRVNAVWRYILRPLNRFEADLKVGYAWLPGPFTSSDSPGELSNSGVVVRGELRYVRPQLLFNIFDLTTGIRASRDVELNYNVRTFGADVALSHRPTSYFQYNFGYALDLVRETSTVRDFADSYRMGYFKLGGQLDFRDDMLQPTKGAFIGVEGRLGEPFAGEFFFASVTPDIRGYIPMGDRLTLALRATAGWIFNFTNGDDIPQNYRLYGGGATDFRGVPYRRLSPYSYSARNDDIEIVGNPFFETEEACQEALINFGVTEDFTCDDEPVGGLFKALFSIEPRFELGEDWLFGALFADFGTVQRNVRPEFSLGEELFHLAVGGGLRLATPVGPIRADIGYRITDSKNFSDVRDITFYIAVGEAF